MFVFSSFCDMLFALVTRWETLGHAWSKSNRNSTIRNLETALERNAYYCQTSRGQCSHCVSASFAFSSLCASGRVISLIHPGEGRQLWQPANEEPGVVGEGAELRGSRSAGHLSLTPPFSPLVYHLRPVVPLLPPRHPTPRFPLAFPVFPSPSSASPQPPVLLKFHAVNDELFTSDH